MVPVRLGPRRKKKRGPTLTRIATCALIAAVAAACTNANVITITPEEWEAGIVRQSLHDHGRVIAAGLPLLAAAVPQCGRDVMPTLGATFVNAASAAPMDRVATETVIGTDERLQAVAVASRLAGTGGLQVGDLLVRVRGQEAPRGETAVNEWARLSEGLAAGGRPFDVTVLRSGQEIDLLMQPTTVCSYRLDVWNSADIFARTTGTEINVTSGLLQFAQTEQQLAVVLGHEIAHNTLQHARITRIGDIAGPVSSAAFDMVAAMIGADAEGALARRSDGDAGTGSDLHPIEQELEADYVGLYIMAAAGMEFDGADEIWRRMRDTFPDDAAATGNIAEQTHPTHAARFAALRAWIPEIKAKQARRAPLVPEQHDWSRVLLTYGGSGGAAGTTPPPATP
jgi:beta-barrel assembly-enhancing protease